MKTEIASMYEFFSCCTIAVKQPQVAFGMFVFFLVVVFPIIGRVTLSLTGCMTSYTIYSIFGAKRTGERSWGMITFSNGIHIHHWLYCTIICILTYALNISHPFVTGLMFGGVLHGLQFSDWYVLNK